MLFCGSSPAFIYLLEANSVHNLKWKSSTCKVATLLHTVAIHAVSAITTVTCTQKATNSIITVRIIATIVQSKRTFVNICKGYQSKILSDLNAFEWYAFSASHPIPWQNNLAHNSCYKLAIRNMVSTNIENSISALFISQIFFFVSIICNIP